ncbi:serine hydrolase-like protein [Phymastichus coffea]|uniref:serine hydrolase-like protein n=1 Tax=Phymastichus coffea TaxID=108790 RepID=UPI00273C42C5|nr:serine hydrolase-like protein [Phymastichus coffea]XP_058802006.1 serine hydrolase-like protein [Phymastichus coffea]
METTKEFLLPVPWGHIAAKAWGNPTNFPVLCIHGVLDNAGAFDRLIAQLPTNYYYVSIDLPGHGFSSHFPAGIPLDFFNYILSIRYIIEKLKWKTFKLIGHSMGGQLGTFYSVLYPNQIQSLVLIEGFIPKIFYNKEIISRLTKVLNTTFEAYNQIRYNLYTHDDIMYTLKYKRANCLNNEAAEAIFKRSVTQEGKLFKYNRDIRLKDFVAPIFNISQWMSILSNLNIEILIILTTSSYSLLIQNQNTEKIEGLKNLIESFDNFKLLMVCGNHDVHNNNPERISHEISKFLDKKYMNSKL